MDTIARDQTPNRDPAHADAAASAPRALGDRSQTSRTGLATRRLYGCARHGCLEIAKPGEQYCPLHD